MSKRERPLCVMQTMLSVGEGEENHKPELPLCLLGDKKMLQSYRHIAKYCTILASVYKSHVSLHFFFFSKIESLQNFWMISENAEHKQ